MNPLVGAVLLCSSGVGGGFSEERGWFMRFIALLFVAAIANFSWASTGRLCAAEGEKTFSPSGSIASCVGDARIMDVGDRKQLFIDKRFMTVSEGIELVANPPVKKDIVFRPDKTEMKSMFWISAVLEVDGKYLMYYGTRPSRDAVQEDRSQAPMMRLLESTNGLDWQRVHSGQFDIGDGTGINNNIVMVGGWGTIFLDPNETDGYRFWMMGHARENLWRILKPQKEEAKKKGPKEGALHLCRSKDGIHWERIDQPALPFACDTRNQCLFDARLGKYVAYVRGRPGGHMSRVICRAESDTLIGPWPFNANPDRERGEKGWYGWVADELPIVMDLEPFDPPKFGLYTPNLAVYPWAQDVYLAFPGAYRLRDGIESHGRDERGKPGNEGPLQPAIAVSRDGIQWHRFQKPYLPLGRLGQIDSGTIYMAAGMIRQGDEIYQYASASPTTHHGFGVTLPGMDGGILRTAQRLDGFVSADAGPDLGQFMTPPMTFAGDRLMLNVDCSALGEVWVEILDAKGTPIPGYAMDEAVSVDLNGTAQEVWWKNGPNVRELAGKPIRLRFRMRSAKLYAFQFVHHSDG